MHLFILVFLEEKNKAYESCLTLKIFDQHVQKKHLTWKVLFTLCVRAREAGLLSTLQMGKAGQSDGTVKQLAQQENSVVSPQPLTIRKSNQTKP